MPEITQNSSTTVGASIVNIAYANMQGTRLEFSLRNNSTGGQVIYVFLSDTEQAAVGAGIPLAAGQSLTQSRDSGYTPWQGNITAIADAAGGALSTYMRTLVV